MILILFSNFFNLEWDSLLLVSLEGFHVRYFCCLLYPVSYSSSTTWLQSLDRWNEVKKSLFCTEKISDNCGYAEEVLCRSVHEILCCTLYWRLSVIECTGLCIERRCSLHCSPKLPPCMLNTTHFLFDFSWGSRSAVCRSGLRLRNRKVVLLCVRPAEWQSIDNK